MTDRDPITDPCPPPGERPCPEARAELETALRELEQRMTARILAEHQDTVRDVTAELEGFREALGGARKEVNELASKLDTAAPRIERAIQVCTVLEARYPVLKATGEATLHELGNTRITAEMALAKAEATSRNTARRTALPYSAAAVVLSAVVTTLGAMYVAHHTQAQAAPAVATVRP